MAGNQEIRDSGKKERLYSGKKEYRNCKRYRRVYKYDLCGNIVAEYENLSAASSAEGIHPYTLLRHLTGRIRVSNSGFVFKWEAEAGIAEDAERRFGL